MIKKRITKDFETRSQCNLKTAGKVMTTATGTCQIKGCKNNTFRRNLTCPTHRYRRKHRISLDLPIRYLKHGLVKTSEYRSWTMMKNRCTNLKATDWRYYGGRGITLCKRWYKFKNFLEDMGKKPTPKYSIDRINNYRGYSPSNCRWATRKEQRHNQRIKCRA